VSYGFGKPLTRAFQKHITWPLFLAIKKIWLLFDINGLFHGDRHLKHPTIGWQLKLFGCPRRHGGDDFIFSKII
jgi:hypothetical protein